MVAYCTQKLDRAPESNPCIPRPVRKQSQTSRWAAWVHLCRYTREIQSHRPTGLRVSFWPQDNLRVEDMPSLQTYRSSALAPLMFALLADAPRGHPLPHVAEFPGLLEHQAGEKVFSSTSAEFPLASYEILVGLERRREVRGDL